jgi:hypothetical protein
VRVSLRDRAAVAATFRMAGWPLTLLLTRTFTNPFDVAVRPAVSRVAADG